MNNGDKPFMPTGVSQSGTGLTKREYFAAMAMQGMISNPMIKRPHASHDGSIEKQLTDFSAIAVEYADALLKALEQ